MNPDPRGGVIIFSHALRGVDFSFSFLSAEYDEYEDYDDELEFYVPADGVTGDFEI